MAKGELPFQHIVIVATAIVLLVLVIVAFFYIFWPYFRFGIFSPCWAGAVSRFNTMTGTEILRSPQQISIGDCVNSIHFVNRDKIDAVEEMARMQDWDWMLDCERGEGYKSYAILIPTVRDTSLGLKFWNWPANAWNKVVEFWQKTIGGVKPVCKSFDEKLSNELSLPGPQENGGVTYCIGMMAGAGAYDVSAKVLKEKEECTYKQLFGTDSRFFGGGDAGGGGGGFG
jgi:hypothetical protein